MKEDSGDDDPFQIRVQKTGDWHLQGLSVVLPGNFMLPLEGIEHGNVIQSYCISLIFLTIGTLHDLQPLRIAFTLREAAGLCLGFFTYINM